MLTTNENTRTTLWDEVAGGKRLVQTLAGAPYGIGEFITTPGYGKAKRSGLQLSGSPPNEAVVEVQFTLERAR